MQQNDHLSKKLWDGPLEASDGLKARMAGSWLTRLRRLAPLCFTKARAIFLATCLSPLLAQTFPGATLSQPANGGILTGSQGFSWAPATNAQAYYLKIGSTPGAMDIWSTGETLSTSFSAASVPPNQKVYARLSTKVAGHWYDAPDVAFTAVQTATFTSPSNGGILNGTSTFQWTPVSNAQAYYLYVGTTQGAQDLAGSGETLATSQSVALPALPNQLLWARINTKIGGYWYYRDVSFYASIAPAVLAQPSANGILPSGQGFSWAPVANAQAYYLKIGSTPGATDIWSTGETLGTSFSAASIPPNQKVYARLSTKVAGHWYDAPDVAFTAVQSAAFMSPSNGGILNGTSTFQWTPVSNAQAYYLYVGTTQGAQDLAGSGETLATSQSVALPALPNQLLWARINTKIGGYWYYRDVSFYASIAPAVLAQPSANGILPSGQGFSWAPVTNAQAYYLKIGSTPGATDIWSTGETLGTSFSAASVPPNQKVYARLSTKVAGHWYDASDVAFTAVQSAAFTSPSSGGVLDGTSTFQWTSVPNAQAYYLYVGTTQGARDVYGSGEVQTTQCSVSNMPANQQLFARINTKIGGYWYANDIQFTAIAKATFIQPANGQGLDGTQVFSWTSIPSAQAYFLKIGTAPGLQDLYRSGETLSTTETVTNLPVNVLLHARIYTKINGNFSYYADSSFYMVSRAEFTDQQQPTAAVNGLKLFQWTTPANAQSYYLQIGSSPGAADIYHSGEITNDACPVTGLPSGTLYLRLYTRIQGLWIYYTDSTCSSFEKASFLAPANGAAGVSGQTTFQWNAPPGASAYQFILGTSPAASDIADSGVVSSNQFLSPALDPSRPYYARVWSCVSGNWYFSDLTVNAQSSFIFPSTGGTNIQSSQPFEWTPTFNAASYTLQVGTTLGGNDVLDTGPIPALDGLSSVKRFVDNLPGGAQLFARLTTTFQTASYTSDVAFTTGPALASPPDKTPAVLWATAQIRAMADYSNIPLPGTELEQRMQEETGYSNVTCLYYALALNDLLAGMNAGQSAPVSIGFANFAHKVVKYFDASSGSWITLDPTYGLSAKRASDGGWASIADIQSATLSQQWASISYVQLTPMTANLLSDGAAYYFDYPLLYLNVFDGIPFNPTGPGSPMPYLVPVSGPIDGPAKYYFFGNPGNPDAAVVIDSDYTDLPIDSTLGVTEAVWGASVSPVTGTVTVYRPGRFVF